MLSVNFAMCFKAATQLTFNYSKSTIETIEEKCEICSVLTIKTPFSSVTIVEFEQMLAGYSQKLL